MKFNFWRLFCTIIGNEKGNMFLGDTGGSSGEPGASDGGTNSTVPPINSGTGDAGGTPPADNKQGPKINFPEGITEELKTSKLFDPFVNTEGNINYAELMKSYAHTKSLVGRDKVVVPNKDTTEDEWKNVYRKLGLPEKLEEYTIDVKEDPKLPMDKDFIEQFKKTAHEVGVLPKQAQKIVDFYNNKIKEKLTSQETNFTQQYNQEVANLKKEWGESYDSKLKSAESALKHYVDEDTIKILQQEGTLASPALTKVFAKIAEGLKEDTKFIDEGKQNKGIAPEEVNSRIQEFFDPKSSKYNAFQSKTHPNNKAMVDEYMKLMELKVKYQSAGA